MLLRDRVLFMFFIFALAASMFVSLVVIIDSFSTMPIRPSAAMIAPFTSI